MQAPFSPEVLYARLPDDVPPVSVSIPRSKGSGVDDIRHHLTWKITNAGF